MSSNDPFNTPEKKYVRDHWLEVATQRKIKNRVGFINYCTLPGKFFYDVTLLKPLLKETKTGIDSRSLTFIERDIETFVDIRDNLPGARAYNTKLEYFIESASRRSNVSPDRNPGNVEPLKCFPYDVINLDFTGSVFKHNDGDISSQMKAIYQLFNIQNFTGKSFSLFLTAAGIKHFDDDSGRNAVNDAITDTLVDAANIEFKNKFESQFPGITSPYYSTGTHRALEYKDFLLLGIPLIVINYGFSNHFDVKCVKRFSYIGTGNTALMLSFIFDCEKISSMAYRWTAHQEILQLHPQRLCEIFDHHENINSLFESNPQIKEKYL